VRTIRLTAINSKGSETGGVQTS